MGRQRQRECGVRIPHSVPFVRDRAGYGEVIAELLERRLGVPRPRQVHTVGVFVKKKSWKLRLIFDTQRCNPLRRVPEKTGLPTAAGFGRLELVREQDLL